MLRSVDHFAGNLPQQLSSLVGREDVVADVAELVRSQPAGHADRRRRRRQDPAGARGRRRAGRRVPRRRVDGRAGAGRRPGVGARGDRDGARHHAAGRRAADRHGRRGAGRPAAPARGRQLRARPGRRRVGHRGDPRPVRERQGPGDLARGPRRSPGRRCSPCRRWRSTAASTSDAVTLFVDRARAVRPDFGLQDPTTAAAVIEICETLDGLPLGIELAAARMAAMSAVEVRDRLADRFRLLQGSTPGPERQHTLRHAVEWSYDLLDRRRARAAARRRRSSPAAST